MALGEPSGAQRFRSSVATRSKQSRQILAVSGVIAIMRHPAMVALLSLVAVIQVYRVAVALPGRIHEEDFADYYAAAQLLREGGNPYRIPLASIGRQLGLNVKTGSQDNIIPETPALLLGLRTLGALPLNQAYWTWIGLNAVSFIISLYLLFGLLGDLRPADHCTLTALILMYPPLINLFMTAQSQALLLLILVLATRFLLQSKDGAAGLMLATATLLRGFPGLIGFYFLLTRRWRALMFMIAGGVVGTILTATLVGWRLTLDFPHGILAVGADRELMRFSWNTAPASFVWRVFLYLNDWNISSASDRLGRALGYGVAIFFFALTLKTTISSKSDTDPDCRHFCLWVITSIEVLPVSWLNYTTLLLLPFVLIASASAQDRVSERTIWAAIVSYILSLFAFGGLIFLTPSSPVILAIIVGESKAIAAMIGYLSAYWFAADEVNTSDLGERCGESAEILQSPSAF